MNNAQRAVKQVEIKEFFNEYSYSVKLFDRNSI